MTCGIITGGRSHAVRPPPLSHICVHIIACELNRRSAPQRHTVWRASIHVSMRGLGFLFLFLAMSGSSLVSFRLNPYGCLVTPGGFNSLG